MKKKYNSESIKFITLFESMTGAKVKDCLTNDKLMFIIEENYMGLAVGKNGVNLRRIESLLKKRVKVVEFNKDRIQFIRNMIYPIEALGITELDDVITIKGKDANSRAILIGRERQNLHHLNSIVKRHYNIKEIKVE